MLDAVHREEPEMKPRILAVAALAAALALLLAPTAAMAKGASAATINGSGPGGPGNGPKGPITLRGEGEPGSGTALATLADLAGLFPAMFGQSPNPMLAKAPTTRLGPRYVITWTIPDGTTTAKRVRQDVYPYAAGGPVTYMRPGQPVFDQETLGGWFRATDSLRQQLISLGLPRKRPLAEPAGGAAAGTGATAASGGTPAATGAPAAARPQAAPVAADHGAAVWPLVLAGGAFLLLAGGSAVLARRRRPGAAATR